MTFIFPAWSPITFFPFSSPTTFPSTLLKAPKKLFQLSIHVDLIMEEERKDREIDPAAVPYPTVWKLWLILTAVSLVTFMIMLDASILATVSSIRIILSDKTY